MSSQAGFPRTTGETRSRDGTTIRWVSIGAGPALVMVHGGLAQPESWLPLADLLAPHLTCVMVGRRGHGFSDSGPHHSFDKEAEDLTSVLDAVGSTRWLFGSSSGAVAVLEAALVTHVDKLIVEEPPLHIEDVDWADHQMAMESAITAGDVETAYAIAMEHRVGLPFASIAARRSAPDYQARLDRTASWVNEMRDLGRLQGQVERYRTIRSSMMLVWGTATVAHCHRSIDELKTVFADARVLALEGQGHGASRAAPLAAAAAIRSFLLGF